MHEIWEFHRQKPNSPPPFTQSQIFCLMFQNHPIIITKAVLCKGLKNLRVRNWVIQWATRSALIQGWLDINFFHFSREQDCWRADLFTTSIRRRLEWMQQADERGEITQIDWIALNRSTNNLTINSPTCWVNLNGACDGFSFISSTHVVRNVRTYEG